MGHVSRKPDLLCMQKTKAQLPASVLALSEQQKYGLFNCQEHLYFFKA